MKDSEKRRGAEASARTRGRPTGAASHYIRSNLIGFVALFVALGGGAYATHTHKIATKDLRNKAVKTPKLANNAVKQKRIARNAVRPRHIVANAVRTPKLADSAVSAAKIDPAQVQRRVTGTCPAGQSIRQVLQGGGVACQAAGGPPSGPAGGDLTGNYPNPQIANLAVTMPKLANNSVNSTKVVDGSLTADDLNLSTLPFWRLGGNAGTAATQFLGTTDNQALNLRVNNARALRLAPALFDDAPAPNVIGGSPDNAVAPGAHSATISGGGRFDSEDPGTANRVNDALGTVGGGGDNIAALGATVGGGGNNAALGIAATVGGGFGNTASAGRATVGGGQLNRADGSEATVGGGVENTASGNVATVGGGRANTASFVEATVGGGRNNTASFVEATVGGGRSNTASAQQATVGGGGGNTASGPASTVAGGIGNTAAGDFSFVAGHRARNTNAAHDGVFLFADSTAANFTSAAAKEFAVRASGGFRFRTNAATTTGCNLPAGSGTFACTSDRRTKRDFDAVDARQVLRGLTELPITTWSYKSDLTGTRHMGPVAQDFHAAFGLGSDEKTISAVDADGVALAAIQGLSEENQELLTRIEALEGQLAGTATAGSGGAGPPAWSVLAALGIAALIGVGALGALAGLRRSPMRRPALS